MIFKPLITLIFIGTLTTQAFSQPPATENLALKGLVTDKETQTPLAYVSVGILNKPLGTVTDTTGWNKIDLESCHIKITDEFIVTVQWIESRMDKKEDPITILPVALTPFSKNCYARIASQDQWKRMAVNLSSYVTLEY